MDQERSMKCHDSYPAHHFHHDEVPFRSFKKRSFYFYFLFCDIKKPSCQIKTKIKIKTIVTIQKKE
ncbi:hypothetical protein BD560DRAFT_402910 [Blakeslea trispora]|nr:hypothetical protein BD560DRAFT_402910 [Blakeslea trispora]